MVFLFSTLEFFFWLFQGVHNPSIQQQISRKDATIKTKWYDPRKEASLESYLAFDVACAMTRSGLAVCRAIFCFRTRRRRLLKWNIKARKRIFLSSARLTLNLNSRQIFQVHARVFVPFFFFRSWKKKCMPRVFTRARLGSVLFHSREIFHLFYYSS